MARYIEYYEVKTQNGYLYYFMPVDVDAVNKENLDSRSHRIWKLDTKTNRIIEVYNIREGKPQVNRAEFMKIQLMASPVQYSDYYLSMEQAKEWREKLMSKKSSTVD
jgi:hypothetical protein